MNDYYRQHGASTHIALSSNIRQNKSCWIQIVGCIQRNNTQMNRTKNQILNPGNHNQDYQTKTESRNHTTTQLHLPGTKRKQTKIKTKNTPSDTHEKNSLSRREATNPATNNATSRLIELQKGQPQRLRLDWKGSYGGGNFFLARELLEHNF